MLFISSIGLCFLLMTSSSTSEHREKAERHPPVRVAVLTFSDTRTIETDGSGAIIKELLAGAGHEVVLHEVLKDDPEPISVRIQELCSTGFVDAILTNGGTGIAPRDGAYEAVAGLLDKTLPGFGEIFRVLSFEEVGAAAMLSRAVAGIRGRTVIFSMPGSRNAVRVAMEKLICPELAHLVWEMKGKPE